MGASVHLAIEEAQQEQKVILCWLQRVGREWVKGGGGRVFQDNGEDGKDN